MYVCVYYIHMTRFREQIAVYYPYNKNINLNWEKKNRIIFSLFSSWKYFLSVGSNVFPIINDKEL